MTCLLPEKLTLRSSPLKWLVFLLMSLVFVALGVFLLQAKDNDLMGLISGWACVSVFGLCSLIFIIQLIKPGRLILDRNGFEEVVLNRRVKINWADVSEFSVYSMGANKFVCYSHFQDEGKWFAELGKNFTGGYSGQLSDTFGMKSSDLAELMNQYREAAH